MGIKLKQGHFVKLTKCPFFLDRNSVLPRFSFWDGATWRLTQDLHVMEILHGSDGGLLVQINHPEIV